MSSSADAPLADYSLASQNRALRGATPFLPKGIELAALATVPHTDRDDSTRRIACPPYVLHAQMQKQDDGTEQVAFFAAYDKESQRLEYIVQPEAVEAFKAGVLAYKVGANITLMNGGPAREYQKESVRSVDAVSHARRAARGRGALGPRSGSPR